MHPEIRQNLEDFLQTGDFLKSEEFLKGEDGLKSSKLPPEFHTHLGECGECFDELRSLGKQSQLLRSLRSPVDVEPHAGFYARVMERIEAQPASIWSVFLDRKFGLRLAVASAALIALLGTYLVTSEPSGPEFASSPAVVLTDPPRTTEASNRPEPNQPEANPPAVSQPAAVNQPEAVSQENDLRQQRQRDAVLVDLASYHQ